MKNKLLILSLWLAIFSACNKDSITANDKQVGESTVTYYVVLTLKGPDVMSVVKGTPFTDPGAEATENGVPVTYTTSGSVDVSTTGLYVLTYTSVNQDGYSSSVSRTVVVIASAPTPGVDISGTYNYVGSSSYASTVVKVAEGVYSTDNCWSGTTIIPCIFVCLDGATIDIPSQSSAYGEIFGDGTLSNTGKLVYVVSIPNFGISASSRNWQKN
ncbi:MAG: immunoglobulin-like domain-containing protein [Chitinophagales bacterium]